MKLFWRQVIYIFALLPVLRPVAAAASQILVSPAGPVVSIRAALQAANEGDTVLVEAGTYREGTIIIKKGVHLIGRNLPIIDGEGRYEVITVTADNVEISGFQIQNSAISFMAEVAGIKLRNVSHCRIANNKLLNNFFAIYIANSQDCQVVNNEIYATARREANSGNGIHLWYCKDVLIENNRINGHRDGIYFEFVEHGRVRQNISENNLRYGLHFMFSHYCHYTGNIFRHNGAGVAVMYTRGVEMSNNRFERNWGAASFGLLLKEITDSDIRENIFSENSIGLYTEGSNRLQVVANTFRNNGWAVKIMANSMENEFKENNFIQNTFDVATNSRQNFNVFSDNYWSAYRGYDLDRDGVGDVPFRPVRLFSFLTERQPPSLILLRSLFINILDVAERMIPVLTPETLVDVAPRMAPIAAAPLSLARADEGEKKHD